ncbi:glucose 1-dehydrogenase [uncultured Dysosmobacter sp.]|uniref:glucose 1-dehydrogenase n=1 Tax=uncultured Dysosmobacter sp. TaxID=2591384 RepID=UPI00263A3782|nr:glucose 1-dehydrogenase [uncultured Dysosmobacter sp.]
MTIDLIGKRALVTGGSRGIGRRLAQALHDAGAEVTIFYNSTDGEIVAQELRNGVGAAVHAVQCNVEKREDIQKAVQKTLELMDGRIDILINAAGINRRYYLDEFPMEEWDKVININLNAAVYCTQLVGRVMLEHGYGKIINLASMNSFVAAQRVGAYVASKGAIAQITKAFANEWGSRGIRVNAIAPGYIRTDMTQALQQDEKSYQDILKKIPLERWGTPDDLVGPVLLLASDASDYVNGIVMPIDGGYLTR